MPHRFRPCSPNREYGKTPCASRPVSPPVEALSIVRKHRAPDTPVGLVRDAYRPDQQVTVTTLADLAAVTTDLRSRRRELRVATKYANLTRQFLYAHGINYFTIEEATGIALATRQVNLEKVRPKDWRSEERRLMPEYVQRFFLREHRRP